MSGGSSGVGSTTRAAFFDVHETLIPAKSMFMFLSYWIERRDGDSRAYHKTVADIRAHVQSGAHRTEINPMYYQLFAGVPYGDLLAAGRDWYREYRESPNAFIGDTLSAISWHQARGDLIVLVSGSFQAYLEPLAGEVLADRVVCTEPIVDHEGRLTGEVVRPMIGTYKAAAVTETVGALKLIPEDCFCYGGHSSDLQMMLQVGHPRVVGEDPVLLEYARRNAWPVLSARSAPLPTFVDSVLSATASTAP